MGTICRRRRGDPIPSAGSTTMQEFFGPLPLPLMIGIMVLGIVVVLLACAPTAWVDRALKQIQKRRRKP